MDVVTAAHQYAVEHKWNDLTVAETAALATAGR
jgi:hypothetical protein